MKEEIKKILENRLNKAFSGIYHKHEYAQLKAAIEAIESLVPPECFSSDFIAKDKVREIAERCYGEGVRNCGYVKEEFEKLEENVLKKEYGL